MSTKGVRMKQMGLTPAESFLLRGSASNPTSLAGALNSFVREIESYAQEELSSGQTATDRVVFNSVSPCDCSHPCHTGVLCRYEEDIVNSGVLEPQSLEILVN